MSALSVVLVIGVVAALVVSRFAGQPVVLKRLVVVPVALGALGVERLCGGATASTPSIVLLVLGGLVSLGLGAARGASTRLCARDGHLFARYSAATLAWWAVLVGVRVAFDAIGAALHASLAEGTRPLLVMLGLSLLGEGLVVAARGRLSGIPFAPERRGAGLARASRAAGRW